MRFCPQCGTPIVAGAKFCVECGTALSPFASPSLTTAEAASGHPETPGAAAEGSDEEVAPEVPASGGTSAAWHAAAAAPSPPRLSRAFVIVFGAILVIGLGAAAFILRKLPAHQRVLASATSGQNMPTGNMPNGNGGLPQGNSQVVKLPAEAVKFISQVKAKAEASPKDLAAWDRLGTVAERAGMFDPSYYAVAKRAYAHALKLDPNNLAALRGVGNLDYDRRHYDEAIAAYEHYLKRKPDDPRVRTDLGTMYLSSGQTDLAMVEYKRVIAEHPKFFEAHFNLGVAYAEEGKDAAARGCFLRARALAPSSEARGEIDQMLTSVGAPGGASGTTTVSGAGTAAIGNSDTFHGAFEQMVRALPIAGPKVQAVQWTANSSARLMMHDFPMNKMPPFAATRFLEGLKSSARDVMRAHRVKGAMTIEIVDAATNHVMQSVTVDAASAASAAAGTDMAPASAPGGAAGGPDGASATGTASSGTFQHAVASMMRHLPVAGSKVASVQWPSKMRAKVMMNDFPMQAMPPFARAKFIADIKAGLESAKAAHKVTGTVTVDVADSRTGQVMDSVSE
jgi:tetratricopeptide (TPR) repeat protein